MKKLLAKGTASLLCIAFVLIMISGFALADTVVITYDKTFLRDEPSNAGSVLVTLSPNAQLDYLGEERRDSSGNVWYYASYMYYSGWISNRFASLCDNGYASAGNYDPTYDEIYRTRSVNGWPVYDIVSYPNAERVVANDRRSYIRSGPSTDADDLGTLPKDGVAAYLGLCCTDRNGREWYRINYDNMIGWVSARYTYLQ